MRAPPRPSYKIVKTIIGKLATQTPVDPTKSPTFAGRHTMKTTSSENSMSIEQTVDKLHEMRLTTMAKAFRSQQESMSATMTTEVWTRHRSLSSLTATG